MFRVPPAASEQAAVGCTNTGKRHPTESNQANVTDESASSRHHILLLWRRVLGGVISVRRSRQ